MKKKPKPDKPIIEKVKELVFGIAPPIFFDNHLPKQEPTRYMRRHKDEYPAIF